MNKGKREVLSGLFWKFSERMLSQIVSIVISVILARLLSPDEYGTISLVTVFITISNVFVTSGFGTALIQKKEADEIDFSTVLYFSIAFSVSLYMVLFFAADAIAHFYNEPLLKSVLRILALGIPVMAINSVQQAYISRQMMFRHFFWATLIGTVVSGVVGVYMAYQGYGVYALVAQSLTNTVISTAVLGVSIKWFPVFAFSIKRLKGLFNYGWKLLVQSLVLNIYSSLRSLIIGKVYTTSDLAYYTKGVQYPQLIATNVDTTINTILFPAMAKEQSDISRVKKMMSRTVQLCSYIMNPLLIGFMSIGESFIIILLTEKWLPAVPYLRIICIVLLFLAPQTAMLQAIKALGRSDIILKADFPVRVFATLVLLISIRYGVVYVAISEVATTIFGTVLYLIAANKVVGYTFRDLCVDFLPNTCIAGIMGIITWQLGEVLPFSYGMKIIVQIVFGACVYVGLSYVTKNKSFLYLINEVKSFLNLRRV